MPAVDAAHADAIKRCPIWCIADHTKREPVDIGNHMAEADEFDDWNRSIGDGTARATFTQLTTNFEKLEYVEILIEVEMTPAELLTMADELEKLAVYIRARSMKHTNE